MNYLTRAHWGARPAVKTKPIGKIKGVVIHYAGFTIDVDRDPAQLVTSIQRQHMDKRNWWDVAYNEFVALDGTVVEGRGLLVRSGANGTNTANKNYLAICLLIGDEQHPSPEMIQSVKERIKVIRAFQPQATEIIGHRDCKATSCPGEGAYALVRSGAFQPDALNTTEVVERVKKELKKPEKSSGKKKTCSCCAEQLADLSARVKVLEKKS